MRAHAFLISVFLTADLSGALRVFVSSRVIPTAAITKDPHNKLGSRREWLGSSATVAAGLASIATMATPSSPALAVPVGEGGLPDGARQLDQVLRAQR